LRISYNKIKNIKNEKGTFIDMIKYCINNNMICNKIILSSKEEYGKQKMIDGINNTQLYFYCPTDINIISDSHKKCNYCCALFTRTSSLTRHIKICTQKDIIMSQNDLKHEFEKLKLR
jgi:hypothetical protein